MQKDSFVATGQQQALVARALDSDYMLQVFRQQLPALSSVPIQVLACRARGVKSRAALKQNKVKITYRLTIQSDEAQQWNHALLGTLPVSEEFLSGELLSYCRAAEGHPLATPFVRLATYIPQLALAVHFFPVDRDLPALIALTSHGNGSIVAPYLASRRKEAALELGPRAEAGDMDVRWELVRYKPANRAVLRITVRQQEEDLVSGGQSVPAPQPPGENTRGAEQVIYAKIFADQRGAAIYEDMQALWQLSQRCHVFRVPQPLGYDAGYQTFFMAEAPGSRVLAEWIEQIEKHDASTPALNRVERCLDVVAEALAELHHSDLRPRETRSFRSELARLRQDMQLLRGRDPQLAGEIDRVLARLDHHAIDNEMLVPCHGGFRPKQLVGDEQSLTLLDFDGLTFAHPALDAAGFLCRLRKEPIFQPGKLQPLERLAEQFRRAFLAQHPEVQPRHLALYEALGLTEVGVRSFLHPDRTDQVAREVQNLIRAAHLLLDGLESECNPG
jgi:hypothetical protein